MSGRYAILELQFDDGFASVNLGDCGRSLEKSGAQLEQAQGLRRKVQEHTIAFEA